MTRKLCPAALKVPDWHYTCDLEEGHEERGQPLHRAEDYDPSSDSFREAEWAGPPELLLVATDESEAS